MKKLFKSRKDAETVYEALSNLGYWVEMKSKELPDKTGWYSIVEILGYDN